jgi:hypothetical protein
MMPPPIASLLLTLLLYFGFASAQMNAPPAKPKTQTSFTEKLLKFLGISDSPGTLKGPGDEVVSGELWLADLQAGTTRALTSAAGYRSPIFLSGSKDVLTLRGADVIRIPAAGEEGKKLYSVDGAWKLVAASSEAPATVLILLRGGADAHPRVALLTVSTGAITPLPYNLSSDQDLQMLENLEGWSRIYGDTRISVQKQSKKVFSGHVEWTDVFLQVNAHSPSNVSQCDGVNCGQPSLSPDAHWLVYVRAKAE